MSKSPQRSRSRRRDDVFLRRRFDEEQQIFHRRTARLQRDLFENAHRAFIRAEKRRCRRRSARRRCFRAERRRRRLISSRFQSVERQRRLQTLLVVQRRRRTFGRVVQRLIELSQMEPFRINVAFVIASDDHFLLLKDSQTRFQLNVFSSVQPNEVIAELDQTN